MREIRSYGSVGEREGNDPLYPDGCHPSKAGQVLGSFGWIKAFDWILIENTIL